MSVIALALLASAATVQPSISTATGDWSNIPPVALRHNSDNTAFIVDRIDAAVRTGKCKIRGVKRTGMNLSIPFLLQFDQNGAVTEVVVQNMGCPPVETAMGNAILRQAQRGDYRPTGKNLAGWYRGVFNVQSN